MHTEGYTVFVGNSQIAAGTLREILPELMPRFEEDRGTMFLIFEDESGRQVDFDLRGTAEEILARISPPRTGPGRPRLGVRPREVTLLPRHWDWLEVQQGGASAAIRQLIDKARKEEPEGIRKQRAAYAAGRFLSAMAGNCPGYEEASRSLYADDVERFTEFASAWPSDVREYALRLWKCDS
ncbi:MAG: DUF2239 family protein [Acidobacteriaceae bacterium]